LQQEFSDPDSDSDSPQLDVQILQSRHPLDSVLRGQAVDDTPIPLDDALSFVSDMVCGIGLQNGTGKVASSSSRSSLSSGSDGSGELHPNRPRRIRV
jgi:hypothetical protein